MKPWQIALVYFACGTLTVWLAALWDDEDKDTPEEEKFPAALVFIVWPMIWSVGALWLVANYPNGIKWLGQRYRARFEEKDDDNG